MSAENLYPYTPPEWASKLANPPTHGLKIAQLPTPIYKWNLPGVREGYEVSIKRDDLTGAALSGNKIRKLEFLMVEALNNKCDITVTLGGLHSNHCRATAVISRQLGMEPHLLLEKDDPNNTSIGCRGNVLLDQLMHSQFILCPYKNLENIINSDGTVEIGLIEYMERYAQTLRSKGYNPFVIPVGGCNVVGIWGFIECFKELIDQGALDNYDDIVVGAGAGGTVTGLAIANYLTGSKLKVHGICVAYDIKEWLYSKADRYLKQLGLSNESTPLKSKDIMTLTDDYVGKGYGLSTDEELKQIADISSCTGVLLDRVFTIKAVRGMLDKMKEDPSSYKGKRILFIHTGGIYGLFDGVMDETVLTHPETNKICEYTDVIDIHP